jgi:hypothetical protein
MMNSQTFTATHSAPSLALLAAEPLRALFDFCASKAGPRPVSVGDGHPVVVYPGLGAGALTTAHLRSHLRESGFAVHDWGAGVNTGPDGHLDTWLATHIERVRELHARDGRKVSLVGWSLGGIYAREIARRCPDAVRQVITLATPFAAVVQGNHAGTAFMLLNGKRAELPDGIEARLRAPLPVPTTSVYSRSDGIVSWRGCIGKRGACTESVEVSASHLGMVSHPEVLDVIVDRLAQPEGTWKAYRRRERR